MDGESRPFACTLLVLYTHFTDKETKSLKDEVTCPKVSELALYGPKPCVWRQYCLGSLILNPPLPTSMDLAQVWK